MARFEDEDGVWETTSKHGRVLVTPSTLFESYRGHTPPVSPDTILLNELRQATTLSELKAALIKRFGA